MIGEQARESMVGKRYGGVCSKCFRDVTVGLPPGGDKLLGTCDCGQSVEIPIAELPERAADPIDPLPSSTSEEQAAIDALLKWSAYRVRGKAVRNVDASRLSSHGYIHITHENGTEQRFTDYVDACTGLGLPGYRMGDRIPKVEEPDPVNHPSHYVTDKLEVIDVIEAFGIGFHLGNVVKYVLRAGRKNNTIEDLKKARWYLDRAIKNMEGKR